MSTAKSLFIRRESNVWEPLWSQWAALTEANERLAQRSAEVADLRLLCDELKSEEAVARTEATSARTEASLAREQVASQAGEMQQRWRELDQVTSERDQFRGQAAKAVSRVEALRGQLAEVTERLAEATARAGTLAEGLAVAVESAWSAQAMASQQRARAEGMFCLLRDFGLASSFSSCLKNIIRLSSGFEVAVDESVKNCKALAQAAEQKEADRTAMSEAISAFCRTFGLDDVPSGNSP
jgi:DNA repair exonuclease SbcCD ATPase subunit